MQVGDDNRAITDFDYVIRMEPNNVMAIYNRAVLLHKTGDLRGAIRDYSRVIEQYPNFWIGLQNRAECYRRLGMTNQAELDEFRIFKAQMDKHIGIQPRWSQSQIRQTRKKSEIDMSKYNQIVVEDEEKVEHEYELEYESVYRGKVQHRKVEIEEMPMYHLSYLRYGNIIKSYQVFDPLVEDYNQKERPRHKIYLTCNPNSLSEQQSKMVFAIIDTLTASLQDMPDMKATRSLLLQRAVANSVVQNFDEAIDDLNTCLSINPNDPLALWQRAVCTARLNELSSAKATDTQIKSAGAIDDLTKVLEIDPSNAYVYYDRGNLYLAQDDYEHAIADFTKAITLNANMAEAYYNRGLSLIQTGKKVEGIEDLSQAGELGLYSAYGMIKKYSQ